MNHDRTGFRIVIGFFFLTLLIVGVLVSIEIYNFLNEVLFNLPYVLYSLIIAIVAAVVLLCGFMIVCFFVGEIIDLLFGETKFLKNGWKNWRRDN